MKIAVNVESIELFNVLAHAGRELNHQIVNVRVEAVLFESIEKGDVDAFVLGNEMHYFRKAVDFVKKKYPYVPVVGILSQKETIRGAFQPTAAVDVYVDVPNDPSSADALFYNIGVYAKNFEVLKKLTTKMQDKIEFAGCVYDPTRRMLCYGGTEIKKLSAKEGGILEILAANYGQVVKREIILEKVWHKTDYFSGRSCDVYLTYLRNMFKKHGVPLTIKNISGIGLILE